MKKFTKGLLFGAAVGTIGGLLAAPRSGKDTRQKIIEEIEEYTYLKDEVTDNWEEVQTATEQLKETANTLVPAFIDDLKQEIADFRFQAEPRIAQIKEQIAKISANIPEMSQKTDNKTQNS
jgi:gas vesicle protein